MLRGYQSEQARLSDRDRLNQPEVVSQSVGPNPCDAWRGIEGLAEPPPRRRSGGFTRPGGWRPGRGRNPPR